jgi:hypothetical protein
MHMMRFQILTATSMKMAVFWDVAPCSLVILTDVSEEFTVLMMEAVSTSETSVSTDETAQHPRRQPS